MSHITDEQAQALIDNNDAMKKQVAGVFDCFYLAGILEGAKYFASEADTNILPIDSDEATVKARMKVLLMSHDYRGDKTVTDSKV